ncbi:transglycosylase domain-containing protein [Myxococcus stipitatus]|uniref:transglycosylase domain-containing protein n=1 Tax=Myxococcus stipitatus TaxID=83455 RepID=UPI001F23D3D3|nr:transglycosylase domain-containing protein [Myxococcus stipitatus]MCE9670774.1 transglycosylase domain-containing protein [Myxococcus stipitatus]
MRRENSWRLRLCLWGLILVFPLAAIEWLYRHTLALVPELPAKPAWEMSSAEQLRRDWWLAMDSRRAEVDPIWPWTVAFIVLKVTLVGDRFEGPAGMHLTDRAARRCLANTRLPHLPWLGRRIALSIWFSRHWSAGELMTEELSHLSVGGHIVGAREVARALFGKEWAELSAADVALLKTLHELPRQRRNPWCGLHLGHIHRRRDWLLRHLEAAGGLSERDFAVALRSQLVFEPAFPDWPPCTSTRLQSEEPSEAPMVR